jgi:hypothetical protein
MIRVRVIGSIKCDNGKSERVFRHYSNIELSFCRSYFPINNTTIIGEICFTLSQIREKTGTLRGAIGSLLDETCEEELPKDDGNHITIYYLTYKPETEATMFYVVHPCENGRIKDFLQKEGLCSPLERIANFLQNCVDITELRENASRHAVENDNDEKEPAMKKFK